MRLIDADELLKDAQTVWIDPMHTEDMVGVDAIEAAPTVDAVPVVRCKDCKYRATPWKSNAFLPCTEMRTAPDWFCPEGERYGEDTTRWMEGEQEDRNEQP